MTYLKMVPSNISSDFSMKDIYKGSFIEKDIKDYFDDYLYLKSLNSNEKKLYISFVTLKIEVERLLSKKFLNLFLK